MAERSLARLHVFLARDASIGLVLRRGPSKYVCAIGWNRDTDEFQVGQWLKGRIYEENSDLSSNGRYFIYAAMQKGRRHTAVSQVPYLTALVFSVEVGNCGSGGAFTSDHTYWIRHAILADWIRAADVLPSGSGMERDLGDHSQDSFFRSSALLPRDGWTFVPWDQTAGLGGFRCCAQETRLGWRLERVDGPSAVLKPYLDHQIKFALHNPETGGQQVFSDWSWAAWDRHRLVWATAGQLWAGTVGESGLTDARCLHDFNAMAFEKMVAPYEGVPHKEPFSDEGW